MSLVNINWHPSGKILRQFGYVSLVGFSLIALVLHYKYDLSWALCGISFGLGIFVLLTSFFCIGITKIFYLGLTIITYPIGFVISFLLMSFFYFFIITPLGFVFRLSGRDVLRLKSDKEKSSYWYACKKSRGKDRYFRQF